MILAALALIAAPIELPLPIGQPSLSEARRALDAGRLDQARQMLAASVAIGAKGPAVDRLLADVDFASGRDEQALAGYRLLLVANPGDAMLLERTGILALKLGRSDAVALLDRATAASGAGWRAWNARGVAADREGRWSEADAAYERAAALSPARAEIANNQGWSRMLRGDWSEALAAFERAAVINPALPRLANNLELARAASSAGLPPRGERESDLDYAARLNDAGVVAAAAGQPKKAEAAFAQAIALNSRWYVRAAENLAALGSAH